ncbi:transmembrane and coiled-coil domain protein 3-like [Rhinoraja longicauda]
MKHQLVRAEGATRCLSTSCCWRRPEESAVPRGYNVSRNSSRVTGSLACLEDQLNDLSELHQLETMDLKQELASIEEKVAYQSYERARDIQEALESCQTRLATLELHQQQQQVVQIENANAKVLLAKCINILLAIMTVILVCVSTVAKFTIPLMKSRLHIMCTICAVMFIFICWKKWDQLQCLTEHIFIYPL